MIVVKRLLVHLLTLVYHSRAMRSRAQEARVREIPRNHLPGPIQTFCLEHLATAAHVPAHLGSVESVRPGGPPCFLSATPDELMDRRAFLGSMAGL